MKYAPVLKMVRVILFSCVYISENVFLEIKLLNFVPEYLKEFFWTQCGYLLAQQAK